MKPEMQESEHFHSSDSAYDCNTYLIHSKGFLIVFPLHYYSTLLGSNYLNENHIFNILNYC